MKRLSLSILLAVGLLAGSAFVIPQYIADLYLNTLMGQPYEFMFDDQGETLDMGYTSLGQFEAGFSGIFLYSGIKEAMEQYAWPENEEYIDFHNLEVFSEMAEMDAFSDGKVELISWLEDDFLHYNPAFVRWGFTYMIPAPDEQLDEYTYQEIYDVVGARFVRLLAETHELLEREGKDEEANNYQTGMNSGSFDAYNFIDARQDLLADLDYDYATSNNTDSPFTPGMAYTWWIRRTLDGSEEALWEGISDILKTYDPGFWERL
ncbi:MAG TPA: hypothetical protein DCE41_02575 [Cytophagales bacterium]|nr:hypothetical protein [Cytophagales bacterium]HAA17917.1 hypothetical protein [Cytophagales bacterium]HAP65278.1 hypothetical protein [Cytophagales bacterium]